MKFRRYEVHWDRYLRHTEPVALVSEIEILWTEPKRVLEYALDAIAAELTRNKLPYTTGFKIKNITLLSTENV